MSASKNSKNNSELFMFALLLIGLSFTHVHNNIFEHQISTCPRSRVMEKKIIELPVVDVPPWRSWRIIFVSRELVCCWLATLIMLSRFIQTKTLNVLQQPTDLWQRPILFEQAIFLSFCVDKTRQNQIII